VKEKERHDLAPLDHCLRCAARLARVNVLCPGCRKWIPEEEVIRRWHRCTVEPTVAVDEHRHFTKHNWGWDVLDNPVTPGGQCHQQASLLEAALLCLGVKAETFYIKARPNGALLSTTHDPTTLGASCFDPKRDWGRNFHALVRLDVDPVIHYHLRADDEICYDMGDSMPGDRWPLEKDEGRTRSVLRDAVRVDHDRIRWTGERRDDKCRCGHTMDPERNICPTCGAQPNWAYVCGHCDEPLEGDEYNCPSCGVELEGPLFASIVYPCPSCGKTVHEEDGGCWNCGAELTPRNLLDE
jgi:hypothetical protein